MGSDGCLSGKGVKVKGWYDSASMEEEQLSKHFSERRKEIATKASKSRRNSSISKSTRTQKKEPRSE